MQRNATNGTAMSVVGAPPRTCGKAATAGTATATATATALQYCAPPLHEKSKNMVLSSKTTNNNQLSTYIRFIFNNYIALS
jgi:hypothetical protein